MVTSAPSLPVASITFSTASSEELSMIMSAPNSLAPVPAARHSGLWYDLKRVRRAGGRRSRPVPPARRRPRARHARPARSVSTPISKPVGNMSDRKRYLLVGELLGNLVCCCPQTDADVFGLCPVHEVTQIQPPLLRHWLYSSRLQYAHTRKRRCTRPIPVPLPLYLLHRRSSPRPSRPASWPIGHVLLDRGDVALEYV